MTITALGPAVAQKFTSFPSGFLYDQLSILADMSTLALTELLGAPVMDSAGRTCGRVREVALAPQEDRIRVSLLIVKTKSGDRVLPLVSVASISGGVRAATASADWSPISRTEGLFLLERDLLDQQVIDVHGRKVVRVNDVDLQQESVGNRSVLRVSSVDVGPRGAIRRLLKGIVPMGALHLLLGQIPPRSIPWDFVDLIETDPARRVKLKISHDRLAKLHPADIADIVEELAPDAPPRSSRRCNLTLLPICWRTFPRRKPKKSSRKWPPKSDRKSPACSSSRKIPPPDG
jgi:sporulation protein YlmC with PRC-barrel domain